MNDIDFNLIIPLIKAESQDDSGGWYVRGIAASTDIDQQGDALTTDAILALAEQINSAPIPLRNHHQADSITEDIGEIYRANVLPDFSLEVEGRLDEDNPDAQYLWKKILKKKQYGFSFKGNSKGWYFNVDKTNGRRFRSHPNVMLKEISVTTRPVLAQTFGTVLRKAIDEAGASLAPMGETMDTPKTNGEDTAVVESSAPEIETTQPALSPSQELVKSLMEDGEFVTLIKSTVLEALETVKAEEAITETADSVDDSTEETPLQKADTAEVDVAELVKSAVIEASAGFSAQLAALSERIPEYALPGVLVKSENERDEETLAALRSDPRQALRVGLAARHGELDRL